MLGKMLRGFSCFAALGFLFLSPCAKAVEPTAQTTASLLGEVASFVYFTGIGCPHCANVDSVLLKDKVREGHLLIIEYEIYRDSINAPLLMAYDTQFETGLGVPMIMSQGKKGGAIVGDTPILESLDALIQKNKGNGIPLPAGEQSFLALNLADLPRLPKIWFKNRAAIRKKTESKESESIKKFVLNGVEPQGCAPSEEKSIVFSGGKAIFAKACAFGGWVLLRD